MDASTSSGIARAGADAPNGAVSGASQTLWCASVAATADHCLGETTLMLGRTSGAGLDAFAVTEASRGSRSASWCGSATTVISRMSSSWAKPAARAPVIIALDGSGGARSFGPCT